MTAINKISTTFVRRLLATNDIIQTISKRIKLKKHGNNHHGICPFHQEKTPSFTANQPKQFFYCFGCQKGGNALDFIIEHDKLSFVEAVEVLANENSIPVEYETTNTPAPTYDRSALIEIHNTLSLAYTKALSRDKLALKYLHDRGISSTQIERFIIGLSPKAKNAQSNYLLKSHTKKNIIESGIAIERTNEMVDRFKNRIMFPIRNLKGEVIAFGGRGIQPNVKPKYLNSPETDIFKKTHTIYGLYELLKQNKKPDFILVVEGYMDVISLHQNDIVTAVASLGTAFSSSHYKQIERHTSHIVFCFDGDTAGKQAAWKSAMTSLKVLTDGVRCSFLFLPDGHDPDSFILKFGRESFMNLVKECESIDSFFLRQLDQKHDTSQASGLAGWIKEATNIIESMPNNITKRILLSRIQKKAQIPIHTPTRIQNQPTTTIAQKTTFNIIIQQLISSPSYSKEIHVHPIYKTLTKESTLKKIIDTMIKQDIRTTGLAIEMMRNLDLQDTLTITPPRETWDLETLQLSLNQFYLRWIDSRIQSILSKGATEPLNEKQKKDLNKLLKHKNEIANRVI